MRYTPFESMDRLFEQMRRDMQDWRENAWESWPGEESRGGMHGHGFNADLSEHDGEYVLTVDLPGFEKEEIDLRYDDGDLFLSATHEAADESSARRRSISERVSVPKEIVADGITASYRNGVLEVHLPVVEGAAERGREIDVE